jgi:hypothetical protein
MFPRFLSNLIEIEGAWLLSPYISGTVRVLTTATLGSQLRPFASIFGTNIHNRNGELSINSLSANGPIVANITNGQAELTLNTDDTLGISEDGLTVRLGVHDPLKGEVTENGMEVSLNLETDDFQVEDGTLKTVPYQFKSIGAISIYTDPLDTIEGVGDIASVFDFDATSGSLPFKPVGIRLDTSDDFVQGGLTTLDKKLKINNRTIGTVVYYRHHGITSSDDFYYGNGILRVPTIYLNHQTTLRNEEAVSKGYLKSFFTIATNGALEKIEQADTSSLGVKYDNVTIKVNASNQLVSGLTYQQPLTITNGQVSLNVDNTTIVKSGTMLKANYVGGTGIRITGNSIAADPDMEITVTYPLVKTASNIALNLTGENPINVNDATGKVSITLSPTGAIQNGATGLEIKCDPTGPLFRDLGGIDIRLANMSALSKTLNGLSVDIDPSGCLQKDTLGLDVKVPATGGLEKALDGLVVKCDPLGCIFRDLAGLDVKLAPQSALSKGTGGLQVDVDPSGMITKETLGLDVRVDPVGVISRELAGLDVRVDGLTIKKSANMLQGGYVAKVGSAISIMSNIIGENLMAGNGLQRVGNVFSLAPATTDKMDDLQNQADELANKADDLANRISDIAPPTPSAPSTPGGSDFFKSLSSGISSLGSALAGGIAGLVGGGVAAGVSNAAIGKAQAGMAIASTIAAGIAAGSAAVSVLSTLSDGFESASRGGILGANGLSVGELGDQIQNKWGFSLGTAVELNPTLYTDHTTAVAALTPLKGSNAPVVNSTSPTTGIFVVQGGVGILQDLHVGGSIVSNGKSVITDLTNYYTKSQTDSGFISPSELTTELSPYAKTTYVDQGLSTKANMFEVAQPLAMSVNRVLSIDLSDYYNKSSADARYPLATNVYTKTAVDSLLASKQATLSFTAPLSKNVSNAVSVDLSAYATQTWVTSQSYATTGAVAAKENPLTFSAPLSRTGNAVSINLASFALVANVYDKTASDARYQPLLTFDAPLSKTNNVVTLDTSSFATATNVYTKSQSDATFATISALNTKQATISVASPITLTGTTIGFDSTTLNVGQTVMFPAARLGAPTFTTRSIGTKLVLYPLLGASSSDYAIGMNSNTLWFSVPTTGQVFRFYHGTTNTLTLTNTQLTLNGNHLATESYVNTALASYTPSNSTYDRTYLDAQLGSKQNVLTAASTLYLGEVVLQSGKLSHPALTFLSYDQPTDTITTRPLSVGGTITCSSQTVQGPLSVHGDLFLAGSVPNMRPKVAVYHQSSDNKNRFYFSNNGASWFYSGNGEQYWQSTTDSTLMSLNNSGTLSTKRVIVDPVTRNNVVWTHNALSPDNNTVDYTSGDLIVKGSCNLGTTVFSPVSGLTFPLYTNSGYSYYGGWSGGNTITGVSGDTSPKEYSIISRGRILSTMELDVMSDRRLKKDFAPLEDCLGKLMKVEPCYFKWKTDKDSDRRQCGFVAQNLIEAGLSDAVDYGLYSDELQDYLLTVKDRPIIAFLVQAVKKLANKVTDLESKISTNE